MNKTLTPTTNRLLCEIVPNPYVKPTTIFTGETKDMKPHYFYALVRAKGPDVTTIELNEEIYFSVHAGVPVDINGKDYVVIRDLDVIVTIRETKE